MLASASVPIAFPPVFFDVEAEGGRRYDEMHVDGAMAANLFYSGGVFNFAATRASVGRGQGREDIFIVHNGQLLPVPGTTNRSLRSIGTRAFSAAAKVGDPRRPVPHLRVFAAQCRGIPLDHHSQGVELAGDETFDPVVMRRLYDIGFGKSRDGPEWATAPPGALDPPLP